MVGVFAVAGIAALPLLLRADYTAFAVIAGFLLEASAAPERRGVAFPALTRSMGYYGATDGMLPGSYPLQQ